MRIGGSASNTAEKTKTKKEKQKKKKKENFIFCTIKEWQTYFKVRRVTHLKFQRFDIVSFQIAVKNCYYDI